MHLSEALPQVFRRCQTHTKGGELDSRCHLTLSVVERDLQLLWWKMGCKAAPDQSFLTQALKTLQIEKTLSSDQILHIF